MSHGARRLFVFSALAVLAAGTFARGETWTGAVNSNWTDTGNWNPASVPGTGSVATFDSGGNGNTNISLGGVAQPINTIQFNTAAAAAYNLGVLNSGDQLNFDSNGAITVDSAVVNLQTINAAIVTAGDLTITVSNSSLPASNLGLKLAGGLNLNGFLNLSGTFSGALTIDKPITGPGIVSSTITTGSLNLNAQSTYSGGTFFNSTGSGQQPAIRISVDSVGSPGAVTSGPFGTGTITTASGNPAVFQPVGGDRTVANDWIFTNAIFVGTSASAPLLDPTPHNLTLTGTVTLGTTGRVLTNNLPAGVTLNFGSTTVTSNLALGATLTFQTQGATIPAILGGGKTIINDPIIDGSGTGNITVQNSAIVVMNNANNTYSGVTTVTGTGGIVSGQPNPTLLVMGTKAGAGNVVINTRCNSTTSTDVACTAATADPTKPLRGIGLLGGTGSIAGNVTNNGIIAPGAVAGTPGTLTFTGNLTDGSTATPVITASHWQIELNGASADKLVVGGNIDLSANDVLDVTGTGNASTNFVIATYAGTLAGTFDTLNMPSGYTINYGTGNNSQITLTSPAPGLPGDFNSDGKVDAGDYVTWRKNDGTSNALANDNGLGVPVGPAHYNLWRANFGNPPGSGSGLGASAVPEPAALCLLLFAVTLIVNIPGLGLGCRKSGCS